MAWPTPALDSLIYTSSGKGAVWLHALCRALNERQGVLGKTKTQFIKSGGGEGADLSLADVQALWIGGASDGAITNLHRVMAGLKALVETTIGPGLTTRPFMTSSGSSGPAYSLTSLQTAVGLGSFPDEADSWTDLNFWQQLKESFDLLIYCRAQLGVTIDINEYVTPTPQAAFQDAWDDALAATPTLLEYDNLVGSRTGFTGPFLGHRLSSFGSFPSITQSYQIRVPSGNASLNASHLSGSLTESYYNLRNGIHPDYPDEWTLGSHSLTTVTDGDLSTTDLSIGVNNSIAWGATAVVPTTVPSRTGDNNDSTAVLAYAMLYFDIAAELTDQA